MERTYQTAALGAPDPRNDCLTEQKNSAPRHWLCFCWRLAAGGISLEKASGGVSQMSNIFLSHSGKDDFEAWALRDWLAREGWDDVFLDVDPVRGVAAGERWERALHAAANRCEAVLFLVSANWLASGWSMREYTLARTLNKKLFAVIVDPGISIADLPPDLRDAWQVVTIVGGTDAEVLTTRFPGSHEDKHVVFSRNGLRRLKRGLDQAGLDPKFFVWPPEGERDRAPYRGLKPLEAVDAGILFGRDAPIVEAIDRLRGLRSAAPPRLLVILGASGAGKSSFLRAGLLPRLARDDRNFVTLPVIRPERAALMGENGLLHALEGALPSRTRADLRQAIEAGASALRLLLAELAAKTSREDGAKPPTIVLAIDQADELFRPEGAVEGSALLELISDLSREDNPAVIVLFAIRSDSYDALERAKPLEGLAQSTLALLPMPLGAYKDLIEGPARRYAEAGGTLKIESRLTERLLQDIDNAGGGDALPLLAFTLEQLFRDYRQSGALRLQDYEHCGGLYGALVLRAQAIFDAETNKGEDAHAAKLFRRLFTRLVSIDEGVKDMRRTVGREELGQEAWQLAQRLASDANRIVIIAAPTTGQETAEIVSEVLIRRWPTLVEWINRDRAFQAWLRQLKPRVDEWRADPEDKGTLLRGGPLAVAEDWRGRRGEELSYHESAYIEASLAFHETELRREREALAQAQERLAKIATAQFIDARVQRRASFVRWLWVTFGIVALSALVAGAVFAVSSVHVERWPSDER
jgi:TIR domain